MGLSSRSSDHTHRFLHRAFEQAVRCNLVPRNPCDGVMPLEARPTEIKVLSWEQTNALLDATRDHAGQALYVPTGTNGMRRGELLGLRWDDVTLDAGKAGPSAGLAVAARRGSRLLRIKDVPIPPDSHAQRD